MTPGLLAAVARDVSTIVRARRTNLARPMAPVYVALAAPFAGVALARLRHRTQRPRNAVLFAAACSGIPYLHRAFSRADRAHAASAVQALMIVSLAAPDAVANARVRSGLQALALGAIVVATARGWRELLTSDRSIVPQRDVRVGADTLRVSVHTAAQVEGLQAVATQLAPGSRTLLAVPWLPAAYCITGTASPIREIYVALPASPADDAEMIARIERCGVDRVVLHDYAIDGNEATRFHATHRTVWEHIGQRFRRVWPSPLHFYFLLLRRETPDDEPLASSASLGFAGANAAFATGLFLDADDEDFSDASPTVYLRLGRPAGATELRVTVTLPPEYGTDAAQRIVCTFVGRTHADSRSFGVGTHDLRFALPDDARESLFIRLDAETAVPARREARRALLPAGRGRSLLTSGKRLAAVQSNYIPWKGYFDLINSVDEFVLMDDVQYTKRSWRNRNRIKTERGTRWLTIPVGTAQRRFQTIEETRISAPWARSHWDTLRACYDAAPFFREVACELAPLYRSVEREPSLSRVNRVLIDAICRMLGIGTRITSASEYGSFGDRTQRIVALCEATGAACYVSGPTAKPYLDVSALAARGIATAWMSYEGYPAYAQLHGPFEHAVSIVDLLFSTGPDAPAYLRTFH